MKSIVGFILGMVLVGGCAAQYTRAAVTQVGRRGTEDFTNKLDTNEILLVDATGVVCAAVTTSMNYAGARKEAERDMIENHRVQQSFTYRVSSPAEYAGLNCGFYYGWGSGTTKEFERRFHPTPRGTEYEGSLMSMGFQASGYEELIPDLAAYFMGIRLGGSQFTKDEKGSKGPPVAVNFPLYGGVRFAPVWLYGFGVEGEVGADVFVLALTESGHWYQKINVGSSVVYRAGIGPMEVSGAFGRRLRNEALYDDPNWWQASEEIYGSLELYYPFN